MTMPAYHPRAARGVPVFVFIKSHVLRLRDLMSSRRKRPPTYGVEQLSDHLLRDIGLTRNDIGRLSARQVTLEEIEALRRKL